MHIISREFGCGGIYRGSVKNQKYDIKAHIHQFCEIIFVFEGEIQVTVDGINYTLHSKEAVVITPFQLHEVHTEGIAHFWICVFSNDSVPGYSADKEMFYNRNCSRFLPSEPLCLMIKYMLGKCAHPLYVSNGEIPRTVRVVIYTLLSEFCDCIKEFSNVKNLSALSSLFLYVNEHFSEKINLKSISAAIGYNEKYLSQCLAGIPNMSFPTLLGSLRVDHAKRLLIETSLRNIDIAYECGYDNEQTFHRNFLKFAGMTPGEYRKARSLYPIR